MLKLVLSIEVQEVRSNCCFKRNFLDYKSNYHVSGKNFIVQYLHSFYPLIRLSLFYQVKGTKHFRLLQRYTYRVLQTIPMKLILLCVWAKLAVLGSTFFTFLLLKMNENLERYFSCMTHVCKNSF